VEPSNRDVPDARRARYTEEYRRHFPSAEELWSTLLSNVKERVNRQSFETWFLPTRLVEAAGNSITVEAPNQFFVDWLSEHHLDKLLAAADETLGFRPEIRFTVSEQQPTLRARPPAAPPRPRPRLDEALGRSQLNPRYTFDEFVVGENNRLAHAACLAAAEKPARVYNPVFIYGGVGLGKTHLMQAIGHFVLEENPGARVYYVSTENFMNDLIYGIRHGKTFEFKEKYRNVDLLLIDDVHFLAGKESTQQEFFHTFNALYDSHRQIVLTSDRPPKEIPTLEERLTSRFEWGLVTDIQAPDLETRQAILRKKADVESRPIPDDVLYLIAHNVTSNIRELEGSLIRLLAFASLTGSEITVELAREVLRDFVKKPASSRVTVAGIQRTVARHYGVPIESMKSRDRSARLAFPRQVALFLARELTSLSLIDLGSHFGGRDHATVIHACRKIERVSRQDPTVHADLDAIRRAIAS
jgi:chromosomal replication initiator protein